MSRIHLLTLFWAAAALYDVKFSLFLSHIDSISFFFRKSSLFPSLRTENTGISFLGIFVAVESQKNGLGTKISD